MKNKMDLARALADLQHVEEWKSFVELMSIMIDDWRGKLTKFNLQSNSIEQIAKDRIAITARIEGIELLALQMDSLIRELKDKEKQEENEHG